MTLFEGCVFQKYTVHIFKILSISKGGPLSKIPTMIAKTGLSKGLPWYENQTDLYYLGMPERIRWVPDPGSPLFVEKGSTFGIFGNMTFQKVCPPPFSRDLAMLRGLRMARIRPSRLRILNAGSKIQIGFTKNSNFQKMFEHVERSTKTPKSTPHSYQQMLGLLV